MIRSALNILSYQGSTVDLDKTVRMLLIMIF